MMVVVMATATATVGSGSNEDDDSTRKDSIAAALINRRCSRGWPSLPPSMRNDYHWLLAVIVINCAAGVMIGGAVMVMVAAMATETTIN